MNVCHLHGLNSSYVYRTIPKFYMSNHLFTVYSNTVLGTIFQ